MPTVLLPDVEANATVSAPILVTSGAAGFAASSHLTNARAHAHAPTTLAPTGSNIETDPTVNDYFAVTLYDDVTLANPSPSGDAIVGQKIMWAISQPSSGAHTVSWGSQFNLGEDLSAVTFSNSANKTDYVGAIWTGSQWNVIAFLKGY